jgi:hypothetical protein
LLKNADNIVLVPKEQAESPAPAVPAADGPVKDLPAADGSSAHTN